MLDGLYWEKDYNDANVSDSERGYVYYESKLLGVPRLRQLRVTNESCTVSDRVSLLCWYIDTIATR